MKNFIKWSIILLIPALISLSFAHAQFPVVSTKVKAQQISHPDEMLLYNQLEYPSTEAAIASQSFPDYPVFSCQGADDFMVPPGPPWTVNKVLIQGVYSLDPPGGPASMANIIFMADEGGYPGFPIFELPSFPIAPSPDGNLEINFPVPLNLVPGTYWLSVQAEMPYEPLGQWYWAKQNSPTIGHGLYWRNPGGGFEIPGTIDWAEGSVIPWPSGPINDLNFAFAIFGLSNEPQVPIIESLNNDITHFGESLRVYGSNFGMDQSLCGVFLDGIPLTADVTFWSPSQVYFNCPSLPPGPHSLQIMNELGLLSLPANFTTYIPEQVYFLQPNENERIMSDPITISVAPPIQRDFVDSVRFYATAEGSTDRIYIGSDTDGTIKKASTYHPQGQGNGWSLDWHADSFFDVFYRIDAEIFDINGSIYSGARFFEIDKFPFRIITIKELSKLIGGLTPLDDSIVVEVDVDEELLNDIFSGARPLGGFDFQRILTPVDQDTLTDVTDVDGNDISGDICGPTSASICLDWLTRNSKGSGISDLGGLIRDIANKAGTKKDEGTSDDDLEKAINEAANGNYGIPPITTSRYDQDHNPYGQIPGNLRDSNDVIMLVNQKIVKPDGTIDTVGHYVTVSSHHSEISYQSITGPNGEWMGCVAVQKDYIDFMDPATGQTEYKQVEWYNNPVTIKDYNVGDGNNQQGSSWVAGAIIVKKASKDTDHPKDYVWTTSITPDGSGSYRITIPCSELPEGVFDVEIIANSSKGTSTMVNIMVVNGAADPFSGFEPDIKSGVAPLTVTFNNISQPANQLTSWFWDFGDGTYSNEINPVHIYDLPGIYDVSLVVSDGLKYDTAFRAGLIQVLEGQNQMINIPAGWSGFSGYVMPNNPALETMMQPILNELTILQTFAGMYWPSEGINTIGNFDPKEGYIIKLTEEATLNLHGSQVSDLTLDLEAGWNIIPVIVPCSFSPDLLFSQMADALIICKEIAGNGIVWPAVNISTIQEFSPGKAYFIKLNEAVTITYPDCGVSK